MMLYRLSATCVFHYELLDGIVQVMLSCACFYAIAGFSCRCKMYSTDALALKSTLNPDPICFSFNL